MNKPDFSYINDAGRKVSGTAATNHYIYSVCGGIEQYNKEVGEAFIKEFIKFASSKVNEQLTKNAKKKRFKLVG